jgi:hypothetical protein
VTNFSIGPNPLQVVGQGVDTTPLTVQNSGSVSIYISGDPGVSPTSYEYRIDAGGDFIWPSGKPLSVCTGPGVIGQISYGGTGDVHVNSGSTNVTGAVTINGTVPISGPVTVSGSVALNAGSTVAIAGTVPISGSVNIAGGSIAVNGPVSITGGVSVSGSNVNVAGAVQVQNNVLLLGAIYLPPSVSVQNILAVKDVSIYATLSIVANNPASPALQPISGKVDNLIITWSDVYGNVNSQDLPTYASDGYLEYVIPTRGATVKIDVIIRGASSTAYYIYGTNIHATRRYLNMWPGGPAKSTGFTTGAINSDPHSGNSAFTGTTNAATGTCYYDSVSGEATVVANAGAATVLILETMVGNALIGGNVYVQPFTAGQYVNSIPVIFPENPIRLRVLNAGVGMQLSTNWSLR